MTSKVNPVVKPVATRSETIPSECCEDNNDVQQHVNKIIDYAISAAANWDENETRKLNQKINQHIWASLIDNLEETYQLWRAQSHK